MYHLHSISVSLLFYLARVSLSFRPFSTAWLRLWKMSSTSWLSTNFLCSSSPSSPCSFSRGSFFIVPTAPRTPRRTASNALLLLSVLPYLHPTFFLVVVHCVLVFLDVPSLSALVGVTTLTTGRTRKRWREESGRGTTFTTTMSSGLCSPCSPSPLERDGLSEYLPGTTGWLLILMLNEEIQDELSRISL